MLRKLGAWACIALGLYSYYAGHVVLAVLFGISGVALLILDFKIHIQASENPQSPLWEELITNRTISGRLMVLMIAAGITLLATVIVFRLTP